MIISGEQHVAICKTTTQADSLRAAASWCRVRDLARGGLAIPPMNLSWRADSASLFSSLSSLEQERDRRAKCCCCCCCRSRPFGSSKFWQTNGAPIVSRSLSSVTNVQLYHRRHLLTTTTTRLWASFATQKSCGHVNCNPQAGVRPSGRLIDHRL